MNILKSIGAILAGFLVVVVLSVGTDAILEKLGVLYAPGAAAMVTWMLALALFYRTIYTVLGGYVAAMLSPAPKRDIMILGIIGTIGGVLGIVAGWNLSAHWYPIAIAVLAYPSIWLGGRLRVR